MKRFLMLIILMSMTAMSLGTYATLQSGGTYTTMEGGCGLQATDSELECID